MTLRRKLSVEEKAEVEKHAQQAQTAVKLREAVERFRNTFSSICANMNGTTLLGKLEYNMSRGV